MNFVCWFVTLDTCMGSLGYSWFWVSKTHSHLDTHKILRVILHHNSKLFWVKHTKETRTSWQAVCWPQIRPSWPCQYLFRCSDSGQSWWGVHTSCLRARRNGREAKISQRNSSKIISSADCTELSHTIWYWAYDVLWKLAWDVNSQQCDV